MKSEFGDLYSVKVPLEWLSRGTGDLVPLQEACVFDFMPQLIGSRFAGVTALRERAHFYGGGDSDHVAIPFLALEEAYGELAEDELRRGDLTEALDAYKRGMHYGTAWVQSIARVQNMVLLNPGELEKMNIGAIFVGTEQKLLKAIVQQEVAFNPNTYAEFVREARQLTKRRLQLNQLFHMGRSQAYEELTAPGVKDPTIGRKYMDVLLKMRHFSTAAWLAKDLDNLEEEARLRVLADSQIVDNPRAKTFIDRAARRYERD